MNPAPRLLALWPGWVAGVALQLQQADLWEAWVYAALLLVALMTAAVVLSAWQRLGRMALVLALLATALAAHGLTGWRAARFAAQALDPGLQGRDVRVTGTVAGLPQRGPDGERFVFRVETAAIGHQVMPMPSRVQLGWYLRGAVDAGPLPRAGERWQLTVRLRSPHGPFNPHGFDRERWLWEQGIGATGYVRNGPRDEAPRRLAASGWDLDAARQAVSDRIRARVADPRLSGVLAALVVGDQSAIDRADWLLFRSTGVAHLMSISGLHVTLFAWLATRWIALLWRRLARPWPGLLLAVPMPLAAGTGGVLLAWVYALFAGWGVPSQRTVLMLGLVVGLRLAGRQWPWPALWGMALVAVLLLDPWALLQPGFWLSFVAVGILFAADPAQRPPPATVPGAPAQRWHRLGQAIWAQGREQWVMTLALAPLSLLLFGQVSLVGLLANLLAIPWVTLLLTPLALSGVLWAPLWTAAAGAVDVLGRWLGVLAQLDLASVYRPIPPWPLGVLAVVGGVLLVLRVPWLWRAAGLMLWWPALWWQPPRPLPGEFEVVAMDVGQGSALLVRTAAHSLLYDAGPRYGPESDAGQHIVLPLLRAWGESPDTVVISHRDSDHAGGADAVRSAWPQARWLSSYAPEPAQRCVAGLSWDWDGVRFHMLHPAAEHIRPDGGGALSSNAMSCVLHIHNGRRGAWLGGDLDAGNETRLALDRPDLRADLLVAPHHGSASSSSPVLLNTLAPAQVLIQSGYRNRFNHPSPVVLQRYRERGMHWFNTPQCGAATWRSDRPEAVRCERVQNRRYWHHRGADPVFPASATPEDAPDGLPD
ncbi:MAG: DNA internalization-related competence protein ComEC/Rec2 [Hydrogenophaga sp.]